MASKQLFVAACWLSGPSTWNSKVLTLMAFIDQLWQKCIMRDTLEVLQPAVSQSEGRSATARTVLRTKGVVSVLESNDDVGT